MMKKTLKKIWIILMFGIFCIISAPATNAAGDMQVSWLNILPEMTQAQINKINTAIDEIWKKWWDVMWRYYTESKKLNTPEQVASWIMNWDTIMNYLVFIVQFLSQLWLLVWALFIMYAWYMYIVSLFKWWQVPKKTIINAVIWILVVIFSYAIMKILTSFIWLS